MKWIDLRSDTVTEPTEEMLDAMRSAIVGDDVYEDDPTVKLLEKKSAAILGKESSLFIPTGTFGNQLALLTHTNRGDEVIIPGSNHIVLYEVGAASVISGVQLRTLKDNLGQINLNELESLHRRKNIHFPKTGLICMENAHTSGTVVPIENMVKVYNYAKSKNIPVHLDGARIFNASIALNLKPDIIAKYSDSVMFCFSKGLCSPIGSILAGGKAFIRKARRNRKLMGGGMRQTGYIAAACLISLDKMANRLNEDHKNAKYLAKQLKKMKIFGIIRNRLDINMVFFKLEIRDFNEKKFINYLKKYKIKINPSYYGEFRFVTHYWITKEKIEFLISIIKKYIKESRTV